MVTMKRLSLLFVLVLVSACTPKPSQRTVHEGPHKESTDLPAVTPAEARNQVQDAYANRIAISKQINTATSAQEQLKIALDLEKIVLNPTVLSDPDQAGRSEYDVVLSLFHRALDKAMDLDIKAVQQAGILDRYEKAALAYCTAEAKNCIRLALFRGDHLASRILMRIAGTLEASLNEARTKRDDIMKRMAQTKQSQPSDLEALRAQEAAYFTIVVRFYRLLNLSYEMNNGQTTPQLDQLYVNYARDYFEYFRKLPADQKQAEFHRRHRDVLTLALGHLRNQSSTSGQLNENYCKFLTTLNPLDADSFNSMDLDKRSRRSMLAEFIECTSQKGQLNQLISEYVRKQNERGAAEYLVDKGSQQERIKVKDIGYAYAKAALDEVPWMYNNLGISMNQRTDLAFFILDRVYYQQIDLNVAQSYWARVTGAKDLDILKFAHNYARLQMAYVLKVTLQNYGKIMADKFKEKGGLSSDFFAEVVTDVNAESQFDWDELRDRLTFMREFLIKIYDAKLTRSGAPVAEQNEYIQLKEDLGVLPDHISMAVTVPMTVPLYYYMAKAQGTIKLHLPWVQSADQWFDIPAAGALSNFLRADYSGAIPFFKFGNVNRMMDSMLKKHVIDYAFRTGIFEFLNFSMLDEDKATGLSNETLFYKQMATDLLKTDEYSFRDNIEKLLAAARNRNFSEAFMGACSDPIGLPMTFELSKLNMKTFLNDDAMTNATSAIYDAANFIFSWRDHRENVTQLIKVMESHMMGEKGEAPEVTKARLTEKKFAERQKIIAEAYAELERFNKMERLLFKLMIDLDHQIVNEQRDCLARLHQNEFLRRNVLMDANIEYYKDVHAAMTVLSKIKDANVQTIADAISAYAAQSMTVAPDVNNRANRLLNLVQQSGLVGTKIITSGATMTVADALNEVLRIHNIDTAPYDTIGFFVAGLQTYAETGKRVKSLNSFDAEHFYQGKWDSLIRIRHELANLKVSAARANEFLGTNYTGTLPLAPNVSVPLGTFGELELKGEYQANLQKNVDFNEDQYKFVYAAINQFAGAEPLGDQYVSWYSEGGLSVSLVQKRLEWLKKIQELTVIETTDDDQKNCPRDIWGRVMAVKDIRGRWIPGAPRKEECKAYRVSSADVMDQYLNVLKIIKVSDRDRELLELMNRPGKFEKNIKGYLTYNKEPSTTKWSYFDAFYRANYTTISYQTSDGKTEQIEDIRGKRAFGYFKDSWQQNVQDAPALFPMRNAPTQIIRDNLREKMLSHLDDIMTFEEAVRNLEDRRVDLGDFLIERTNVPRSDEPLVHGDWRVMQVKSRTSGPRQGTPIYLKEEDSAKSWFAGFVETFAIKDTDCFVLPQAGDPDYTGSKTTECHARFNEWKAEREAKRMIVRTQLQETRSGGK